MNLTEHHIVADMGHASHVEESQTTTVSTARIKYCPELPEDPTRMQLMRVMEQSEALSFWRDPAEDIYDPNDMNEDDA